MVEGVGAQAQTGEAVGEDLEEAALAGEEVLRGGAREGSDAPALSPRDSENRANGPRANGW